MVFASGISGPCQRGKQTLAKLCFILLKYVATYSFAATLPFSTIHILHGIISGSEEGDICNWLVIGLRCLAVDSGTSSAAYGFCFNAFVLTELFL